MKVIKNGQRTQTDISQQKPFEIPNNIWKKILNAVNHQGNASQNHSVTLSECLLQRKQERLKAWIRLPGKGTCVLWGERKPATHRVVY